MNYLEAIVKIDSIISDVFCQDIINYCNKSKLKYLGVGLSNANKDIRNVLGKHLDPKKDKFIFNKINKKIEEMYMFYKVKFPLIHNNKVNQIDLLKYEVGGKYRYHIDTSTDYTRSLSVIINLNDTYKGGDLIFVNQKEIEIKRCKLKRGTIVFFPSNFMYPHGIEPVIEGERYSIVSWLQ
jgi:predicted 2-oxoglutarate/Fe(II)-dependent dioxygenase YbiX